MRDSRRTQRPNATRGITITGIASSTNPESRGLVITIITVAPTNSMKLRSAIETEAPTADLICVVSAVSRETSSPLRAESKNAGESDTRCANTSRAQIGDDAFADGHHQIEPGALATASTATTAIITLK